jgi:hypothetical protein
LQKFIFRLTRHPDHVSLTACKKISTFILQYKQIFSYLVQVATPNRCIIVFMKISGSMTAAQAYIETGDKNNFV